MISSILIDTNKKVELFIKSTYRKIHNTFIYHNEKHLSAIGSIEMVLILLVLVSLIVIFKSQILQIVYSIFDKVNDQIDTF